MRTASGATATSSCPCSSKTTAATPASSAGERRKQRRPDEAQQIEDFVRAPCLRVDLGRLRLTHPG